MTRLFKYGTRCTRILTFAALFTVPAFTQPNFSADLKLSFDPNSSTINDENGGGGSNYAIQSASGTVHLQVAHGVQTWSGMQIQFAAPLCAPLSSGCSNPTLRHFTVNFDTFSAPVNSDVNSVLRLYTDLYPAICIGGTVLMIGGPPQPFDSCSGVLDYVGPPPIDAATSYNVSFSVNSPVLGTHIAVSLGSAQFQPSTISQAFTNDTPIGSTLWFNSNGQFKNVPNGTMISFRNASVSTNGSSFTVPDSDIIFNSSTTCSAAHFDSVQNRWTVTVPTAGDNEVFLGGLSTIPLLAAIPKGATVAWNATVFSNRSVSFKWKWGAAAYSTFPTNGLDFVKPGLQTPCAYNNSDPAGTPENNSLAIAGGTGSGGTNKTGTFSTAQSALIISYTQN